MPSLIDVHSHLYPEWYLDVLRKRSTAPFVSRTSDGERLVVIPDSEGVPLSPAFWSVEEKLRFMDDFDIAISLISPGNPWLTFLREEPASSPDLADRMNVELQSLAKSADGRLLALGVLPVSTVDDCVAVVQDLGASTHLRGVISGPDVCELPFDDERLEPFWGALDRSGSVFMIHPGSRWLQSSRSGLALTGGVSFPMETTEAAARLLLAGVPQRWPGVKFLLSHGGGALPFLLGRLDQVWSEAGIDQAPPSDLATGFYGDSLVYSSDALALTAKAFGERHLMWGSDHPFFAPPAVPDSPPGLAQDTATDFLGL